MPNQDQLEIIKANGEIEFYNLDPGKGITNIGRHPENDIIIDTPGVAPFHAVLDHRQKPYQFMVLSHDSQTVLGDRILPANITTAIQNWDHIQLDGHTLILLEDSEAVAGSGLAPVPATPTGPLPARPATLPPPATRPERSARGPLRTVFSTLPPDHTDEAILTEIEAREQTVQVEQSVGYQLTLINGGDIVAMFEVRVEGVPEDWVQITPPAVNLNEGQRASVTITVAPPRLPSARAGMHYLAIVVTSPNYPGRRSQRGVTLNVEPYYEFTVGELSPKRQVISWFKRSGDARLSLTNRSNKNTAFRIAGEDDERACSFEFEVPGEAVGLARQADLQVAPDETISIPLSITPHSRQLVGLRRRTYSYTITTTLLEGQQTPRSLLGELKRTPLIGPFHLVLITLLLIVLIFYIFNPAVNFMTHPNAITAGQEVTLSWSAFPPFFVSVELNEEPVEAPRGSLIDNPLQTTTYEVTSETWLSKLFPLLAGRQIRTVDVAPVRPDIGLFRADPPAIPSGESAVLSWFVVGADELFLVDDSGAEDDLSEPVGSRRVTLDEDTVFTLKATNRSLPDDPVEKSVEVRIIAPTPMPQRPPVIENFFVYPQVITPGQTVTLQWSVSGVESVSLSPIGEGLPPVSPPISHQPQETTLYVLSATNGEETANAVQQVVVNLPPTPTPAPPPGEPPVVELFAITPEETIRVEPDRGDSDNKVEAQLNWVVTGDTTNVEITGGPPGYEKLSGLSRVGEATIPVIDTTVFILTAYGDEAKAVKTAQIKFLDPTPTPEEEGAGEDAGGGGGGGDGDGDGDGEVTLPDIVSFTAEGVSASDEVSSAGGDPPTYNVVAGSNVNLKWNVDDAETVTLVGAGEQPPAGTYTLNNVVADQIFQLTAENADGSSQAFVVLRVTPKPAPPPPFNVNGIVTPGGDINVTWEHAAENEIIGFRVYRTVGVGGPFSRVADESQLGNGARQWTDEGPLPACTGYYVTAVYLDPLSGDKVETGASTNSWYSSGCP